MTIRRHGAFAVGGAGMILLWLAARNVRLPLVTKTFGAIGKVFRNRKVQVAAVIGFLAYEGYRWYKFQFTPYMKAFRMLAPFVSGDRKATQADLSRLVPILSQELKQIKEDRESLKPAELLARYRLSSIRYLKKWDDQVEIRYANMCLNNQQMPKDGLKTYFSLGTYLKSVGEIREVERLVGPIPWEEENFEPFKTRLDKCSTLSPSLLFRVLRTRGEEVVAQFVEKLSGCKILHRADAEYIEKRDTYLSNRTLPHPICKCNNPLQAFVKRDGLLAVPTSRHPKGFYVEYDNVSPVTDAACLEPLLKSMVMEGDPCRELEWKGALRMQNSEPKLMLNTVEKFDTLQLHAIDDSLASQFHVRVVTLRTAFRLQKQFLEHHYQGAVDGEYLYQMLLKAKGNGKQAFQWYGHEKKPELLEEVRQKIFDSKKTGLIFSEKDEQLFNPQVPQKPQSSGFCSTS